MKPKNRNSWKPAPGPEPVDEWLRESLAPPRAQVRRVIENALQRGAGVDVARAAGWRLPVAAAALAAMVMAFVSLALRERTSPGAAKGIRHGAKVTTATITNRSGEVELLLPPGWKPPSSAPGTGELLEKRPVKVFNSDGCMAAVLPGGEVRYWIVGGDT